MLINLRTLGYAVTLGMAFCSTNAHAESDPTGLWLDHNGRGAVEISPCADGNGLCGYVVHIKDQKNTSRCGLQILGNVTTGGGGWIYSPERKRKYPVSLKRLSGDNLRVVGNAGSMFSRTFTWNRAPDHVARCGETVAAAPKATAQPAATPAPVTAPVGESCEPALERTELSHIGASSGALALMSAPKRRAEAQHAVAAPAPEPAAVVAAVTEATPSAAPHEAASTDTFEAEPEVRRMCKFKIPYVGRTIEVPCRD